MALRERLAFGADLTLDRLNVDSIFPVATKVKVDGGPVAAAAQAGGVTTAPSSGANANPVTVLAALTRFDLNEGSCEKLGSTRQIRSATSLLMPPSITVLPISAVLASVSMEALRLV